MVDVIDINTRGCSCQFCLLKAALLSDASAYRQLAFIPMARGLLCPLTMFIVHQSWIALLINFDISRGTPPDMAADGANGGHPGSNAQDHARSAMLGEQAAHSGQSVQIISYTAKPYLGTCRNNGEYQPRTWGDCKLNAMSWFS